MLQAQINELTSLIAYYEGAKTEASIAKIRAIIKVLAFILQKERLEGRPKTTILLQEYSKTIDVPAMLKAYEERHATKKKIPRKKK